MLHPIRTPLLFVALFAFSTVAYPVRSDGNVGPNGVVPTLNALSAGSSTSVQVTLNQTSSTATVVALSSSSPYLSLPSSVTIPAGSETGTVSATASEASPTGTATITASANGLQAEGSILVESSARN